MQVHLVTGGAGFLGANLVRRLLERGDQVVCVDNLVTGGLDRIAELLDHERFKFLRGDVTTALPKLRKLRVTHVWALAGLASPVHYFRRPLDTAWSGAEVQRATLEFAADHGARMLYSSTSELYANPDVVPTPETYVGRVNPLSPRAPYDASKLYGETLCSIFHHELGLDVRIARIFNSFGPWLPVLDGRVVPAFLGAAMRGDSIPVHGDGSQTRSFCYVDDTIAGLMALMEAPAKVFYGLPRQPPVVNIGNPDEITMLTLAEACWKVMRDDPPRLTYLTGHPDDPERRCPDITRARELLRWEPQVPVQDGLRRTADWLKNRHA